MLSLRSLNDADAESYERFLQSSEGGLLYHSWRFRALVQGCTNCSADYIAAFESGEIVGVLPMMSIDGAHGVVLNSLAFFGSHGGVLAKRAEVAASLSGVYRERALSQNIAASTVIENPFDRRWELAYPHTQSDSRIGQVTDLPQSGEIAQKLSALVDGSTRRNIRKAEQSGVTVSVENDALDFLYNCHRSGMAAIGGRPKPQMFFNLLPQLFRPQTDYRIYVARVDGRPVAALLLFYFGDAVEYFIPATDEDSREAQPMALLVFRAMIDAAAEGYVRWNWGGTWTTQTGVYRFKKKWGAREFLYRYFIQVNDGAILNNTPEVLASAYPFFYVAKYDVSAAAEVERK